MSHCTKQNVKISATVNKDTRISRETSNSKDSRNSRKASNRGVTGEDSNINNRNITEVTRRRETRNGMYASNSRDPNISTSIRRNANSNRGARKSIDANNS
jgi:hypothetical protein